MKIAMSLNDIDWSTSSGKFLSWYRKLNAPNLKLCHWAA